MDFRLGIFDFRLQRRRRGITFTEVMFAVIVLGIGFIMLAGLFPVAISQTRQNVEETAGSNLGRNALKFMEQIATLQDASNQPLLTPTPTGPGPSMVVAIGPNTTPAIWAMVKGNLIRSDDPRSAWVALYRRDVDAPYAQVYLVAVRVRNREDLAKGDVYDGKDLMAAGGSPATLQARPVSVKLTEGFANADIIEFNLGNPDYRAAVEEGSFVVIANDAINGSFNGRIYRIGVRRTDKDANGSQAWELQPGYDMKVLPGPNGVLGSPTPDNDDVTENMNNATAWIVGRMQDSTGAYQGPVQDVAAFTSFVRVN